MKLVHKSIDIQDISWRQLRVNAELTGVPLRDYLTWLIQRSQPVQETDMIARQELVKIGKVHADLVQQRRTLIPSDDDTRTTCINAGNAF